MDQENNLEEENEEETTEEEIEKLPDFRTQKSSEALTVNEIRSEEQIHLREPRNGTKSKRPRGKENLVYFTKSTERAKSKSCRRYTLFKKAQELAVKTGVEVCVFIRDRKRLDTYYSNDDMKERFGSHLSTIFDTPIEKKPKIKKLVALLYVVKNQQATSKFESHDK